MEKGFEKIMKGLTDSSPLFQGFSQFVKAMAKSESTMASEINQGLENTAKLFE